MKEFSVHSATPPNLPLVEVRLVGKLYRQGSFDVRSLARDFVATFRKRREHELPHNTFWALKNISFQVAPGQVLGVVGPNGAGKSTLLKLLARISPPSRGEIILRGRLGALLEVGSGFHYELSGRENIYLNGAILGMSIREIDEKFEAIREFSGINSGFLDTPVKRYSSGMITRLGFSVAAHLEPEIIVLDELLAVSDDLFTASCIAKIRQLADRGRAIIVVSHNEKIIRDLCDRCLLLDRGELIEEGSAMEVMVRYETLVKERQQEAPTPRTA